jgi:hypothetical protein
MRRKETAAQTGGTVRVRARAHPTEAPDWRHWRGALVRHNGTLRWRPLLRRWRAFELTDQVISGTRIQRSAADGDRALLDLDPIRRCDHLSVSVDRARIAETVIRQTSGRA